MPDLPDNNTNNPDNDSLNPSQRAASELYSREHLESMNDDGSHPGPDFEEGQPSSNTPRDNGSIARNAEQVSHIVNNFTGKKAGSKVGKSLVSAGLKKIATPFIAGIVLVGVLVIAMLFMGASSVLTTVVQKAQEQTMNATPAILMMRGIQLDKQRLANIKDSTLSGYCTSLVSIRCKLSTFSDGDIKAMEREGIKVTTKSGSFWDKLRGRKAIESVDINGKSYSADELAKAIKSGDKSVTSIMGSATEASWKTYAKNGFYKTLAKFAGTKAANIKSATDRAKLEQELIDRVSGKSTALSESGLINDGTDSNGKTQYKDPKTGKIYVDGTEEYNNYLRKYSASYNKIEATKESLKSSGDKISKFAAKNSVKALAVGVGMVQIGCGAWNIVRSAEIAASESGLQNMMGFSMVILNSASMMRAESLTPEVSNYLSSMFTSTDSAGNSGFDTRAAKQLFYGEQSPIPTTTYADPSNPTDAEIKQATINSEVTDYTAGTTFGPAVLKQVVNAIPGVNESNSGWVQAADTACGVINSKVVGSIMLGAGALLTVACYASAIIPVAGEATVGGCVADTVTQLAELGTIIAILAGVQQLLSTLSGALITGNENGPQAMAAFVTGTEGISYYNGINNGLTLGTNADNQTFQANVVNPANEILASEDRKNYAWYDTSNTNTFLGSIVATIYPKISSLSSINSGYQVLSSIGSIISSPLSLLSSSANAQEASSYCASTIYSGYAVSQNCTPLAVTSQDVLDISAMDSVNYLLDHNEINDEGKPIGEKFNNYINYCTSERETTFGVTVEGTTPTAVTRGDICTTNYNGSDAETYKMIQAYMQYVGTTDDVEIFN